MMAKAEKFSSVKAARVRFDANGSIMEQTATQTF